MNALSNAMVYSDISEKDQELVRKNLSRLQTEIEEEFKTIQAKIASEESPEARRTLMTDSAIEMSEEVHDLALALYRHLTYGEESELIKA